MATKPKKQYRTLDNKAINAKQYLVIGSNNFWYGVHDRKKHALEEAMDVLAGASGYGDEEGYNPRTPDGVYVYEATLIKKLGK